MRYSAIAMTAVAALAVVSGSSVAAQNTFEGVTLSWATLAPNGNVDDLRSLVSEWEEASGGKVDIVVLPHPGLAEKVLLDETTGVATYDLVTLNYPKLGQFVEAGLLQPLDPLMAEEGARDPELDDFIPRLLEAYGQWDGQLYGLPMHADGRIMVYRKDVFDAHGKQPAQTWDEYLELARFFNGKDWDNTGAPKYGVAFRFNADVISSGRFAEVQAGLGGQLLGDGWEPMIATPESQKAMETIVALAAEGPAGSLEMGASEYVNTLRLGQVPQLVVWADSAATMDDPEKSKVVGKVAFGQVPGGAALLGGFGISILANSQNPAAAYDFMTWLTSPEIERRRVPGSLYSPGRTSTYTDPGIVADRPWFPLVKDNLANGVALPRIPEADELINVLGQGTRRAAAGQVPIDTMLMEVQESWTEILTRAGRL